MVRPRQAAVLPPEEPGWRKNSVPSNGMLSSLAAPRLGRAASRDCRTSSLLFRTDTVASTSLRRYGKPLPCGAQRQAITTETGGSDAAISPQGQTAHSFGRGLRVRRPPVGHGMDLAAGRGRGAAPDSDDIVRGRVADDRDARPPRA